MTDAVNPEHYKQNKIECIQAVEGMPYLEGNIIKYVWRHEYKGGIEDLKKARWYLDRLISNSVIDAMEG